MTGHSPGDRATTWLTAVLLAVVLGWAVWSWHAGGIVAVLTGTAGDGGASLARLRAAVDRAGPFGPLAYTLAVVVEVVIAPLPGTLLYAPGGAIFGGGLGGTLSLVGNVLGAMLAAAIARLFGARVAASLDRSELHRIAGRVRERSVWIIALLRVNPLTSSDLVSYAAGLVGVSVWRVGLATLLGMAPLCYAQAYAAETFFTRVPGSGLILLAAGLLYAGLVVWLIMRYASRPRRDAGTDRH